jgi:hypothetical protein
MKLDYTAIRNRARHHQDEAELGSPMFSVTQDVFDLLEALRETQRERDRLREAINTPRCPIVNCGQTIPHIHRQSIFGQADPDVLAHYGQGFGTIPSMVSE